MRSDEPHRPVVLVIEDDPWVRSLEATVLEDLGFRSLQASNGVTALRLAASQRPDLVLLDLSLPEMAGSQVLADLRADPRLRFVPIVVVSGHLEVLTLHEAELADALVSKPFDVAQLEAALRQALDLGMQRRRRVREPSFERKRGTAGKHRRRVVPATARPAAADAALAVRGHSPRA